MKVIINKIIKITTRTINHPGLNRERVTLDLAISISLVSHAVRITSENVRGSIRVSPVGVHNIVFSTIVVAVNRTIIRIAKFGIAHLFLGRAISEALNKIIFSIELDLVR